MAELLKFLSVGGDIGIWILLYVTWRFHDRMLHVEMDHQSHCALDEAHQNRTDKRLEILESK